jgi:hypothetical protein
MTKQQTFRFGNSAFLIDGKVITNREGCPRIILLRANDIEMPIQPQTKKTFALGHVNEEIFIENYIKPLNAKYDVEKEFTRTTKEGTFEVGHSDVIAYNIDTNEPRVFELKSVSSINSHKNYVLKDDYKIDNLAQLINYMHMAQASEGYLVYSSFIWGDYFKPKSGFAEIEEAYNSGRLVTDKFNMTDKGIQITPADKFYKVTFDNDFNILIDDKLSGLNKKDVLRHKVLVSKILKEQEVYSDLPESLTNYSPCTYCNFRPVCAKFNLGEITTTKEFLKEAKLITVENTND